MSTAAYTPQNDDPITYALAYALAGIRVLPIKPGQKRPPMASWQHAATTDPKAIGNWWNGLYRDHGVGLAMGLQPDGRRLFALDVDEHDANASGSDTLAELEAIHGKLPDTVRSITGAGGAHLIFDSGDIDVTNGKAGQVGPGLDVRGTGGQIVVAPTVHPNGTGYLWEHGHAPWETEIAAAPAWLLELVRPQIESPTPSTFQSTSPIERLSSDSPADTLRATWDWPTELARRGWQQDPRHPENWTRPGKDPREGSSAVLHGADGPFVVFTTDASTSTLWRAGKAGNGCVSLSPLAYLAAYDHAGDLSAATRALRDAQGPSVGLAGLVAPVVAPSAEPTEQNNPLLIDWAAFWSMDHTSEEWVAWPLIPAHRQVALYAPAKTGKSIVTLAVCAAAATGRSVLGADPLPPRRILYLDYEMTAGDLHERLDSLGYSDPDELASFYYALLPSLPPLNTIDGAKALRDLALEVNAEAVVIDTMGRAVEGKENDSDSYRGFANTTGILLKAAGVSVLRTDHAGKDREKGQRGSSAKNDDVDIVYRLDVVQGGWKLARTHSRVNWAPEAVVIERHDGDTTELVAARGERVYAPGTNEVVARLRALGLDHTATKRAATDALKANGGGVRAGRITDALAWMKAEAPRFTDLVSPVDKSVPEVGNHVGNHSGEAVREPLREPDDAKTQNPRSEAREPSGNHAEPMPESNREPVPPSIGGPGPGTVPESTPSQPDERGRLL